MIDGVSQSTGVERLVGIESDKANVRLSIRERGGDTDLASVVIPVESLMTALTDQPKGQQTIPGSDGRVLAVEVCRNEVLLAVGAPDAAVGLDDLMDALAGALPSA